MDVTEEKAAARKAAAARRSAAHRELAASATPAATARFLAAIRVETGAVVAGYRPIRSEIDPTSLMAALHARGVPICVPVILRAGQPLAFRAWTPDAAMSVGAFGAEVPREGAWREPTLLITPLLAFDRTGLRLGYGGGFYDRTLALLRRGRAIRAVGLAYAAQEVEAVPHGPTDQRLDMVVTEREAIFCGADAPFGR